jgi:hypothetical protein
MNRAQEKNTDFAYEDALTNHYIGVCHCAQCLGNHKL